MSSAEHNSSTNESALAKDPVGVLRTTDTGPMYKYVMRQTFLGTALGTAVSGGLVWALKRYSPAFTRYTNTSARTTLVFAGTGIGFTLSSDWAL